MDLSLLDFPDEILEPMLYNLAYDDKRALLSLGSTCKRLFFLTSNNKYWNDIGDACKPFNTTGEGVMKVWTLLVFNSVWCKYSHYTRTLGPEERLWKSLWQSRLNHCAIDFAERGAESLLRHAYYHWPKINSSQWLKNEASRHETAPGIKNIINFHQS